MLVTVLLAGCASGVNRYTLVEESLRAGHPERAADIIQRAESEYGSESRMLFYMDRGMALHLAGDYQGSNAVLNQADEEVERLYTRHVTRETKAFLTNDSKLPYEGEPYEQTMINVVKALNYALMGNWTEALVEARRIDHRLNVLTDRTGPKDGYRDDPFARYLTGILYEAAGELNDAFIAYRKAYDLYGAVRNWWHLSTPSTLRSDLLRITDALHLQEEHEAYTREFGEIAWHRYADTKNLGQIVVLTGIGRAPHKEDRFIDVPISLDALNLVLISKAYGGRYNNHPERRTAESVLYGLNGHIIRVAIPALIAQKSDVLQARVTAVGTPGTFATQMEKIGDVTAVAERALADRLPSITIKAAARAVVKYGMAEGIGRGAYAAAGKDAGPLVGLLVGSVAKAVAIASEEADKRSWRTLPDQFQLARLWVPPGEYEVRTVCVARSGASAGHEVVRSVSVKAGETTMISERVSP